MSSPGFDAGERVNKWLLEAFQRNASDIHVEHAGRSLRVRGRIDGTLERLDLLADANVSAVFARLKVMAQLDVNERRLPQDGRFHAYDFIKDVKVKGLDVRLNVTAGIAGEKAVMRLIDHRKMGFKLDELGFSKQGLARYRVCLQRPHGLILHVGPTGSGKSTSLYVATEAINGPGLNMVTVEDPVEFIREGILQAQVNPDIGLTFPVILRALLRQDPDIIMLGEIRDQETAEIALQAASTGHRVLSTLHTNDALGTIGRFKDMGLPGYKVAEALQCVVSQRFVRKLCECRKPLKLPGIDKETIQLFRSAGCVFCKNTGFQGRSAVMEVLAVDERVRAAIANEARSKILRRLARLTGWKTLFQEAWLKAVAGITSPAEVLRVTQGIQIGDQSTTEIVRLVQRLLRAARGSVAPKQAKPKQARPAPAKPAPATRPARAAEAHAVRTPDKRPAVKPPAKGLAPRPAPRAPASKRAVPGLGRPVPRKESPAAKRPRAPEQRPSGRRES